MAGESYRRYSPAEHVLWGSGIAFVTFWALVLGHIALAESVTEALGGDQASLEDASGWLLLGYIATAVGSGAGFGYLIANRKRTSRF